MVPVNTFRIGCFLSGSDPESARVTSSKITTTLGLVVHAAGTSVCYFLVDKWITFQLMRFSSYTCFVFLTVFWIRTLLMSYLLSPADGVALGAAASTSQTSVQLIVFVAIMLHKVIMVHIFYSKMMFFNFFFLLCSKLSWSNYLLSDPL